MNTMMYYFDKLTQWLDFSWLVTLPRNKKSPSIIKYEKLLDVPVDDTEKMPLLYNK